MENSDLMLLGLSIAIGINLIVTYYEDKRFVRWKRKWIEDGIKTAAFKHDNIRDY